MTRLKNARRRGGRKELAIAIAIPLVTGAVSALLSMRSMGLYGQLNRPPLSPPSWFFPVAWTILYVQTGTASYLIWQESSRDPRFSQLKWRALVAYAAQLFLNFCWPLLFFVGGWYLVALIELLVMLLLVIRLTMLAKDINHLTVRLLVPYVVWLVYAAYLNLGVVLLN